MFFSVLFLSRSGNSPPIIQTGRAEAQTCPAQPQLRSDLECGKLGEGEGGEGGGNGGDVVPLGAGQTDLTTH